MLLSPKQTPRYCRARVVFNQPLALRRVANRSVGRCEGGAVLSRVGRNRLHLPNGKRWEIVTRGRRPRQAVTCMLQATPPGALWPVCVCEGWSGGQEGQYGCGWGAKEGEEHRVTEFKTSNEFYLLAWFKSSLHNVFLKFHTEFDFFFFFLLRAHSIKDCNCFQFLFVWLWIRIWCTESNLRKKIKDNKLKEQS